MNHLIIKELIVTHFFNFRLFIITGTSITSHRHFAFEKQNTRYICGFTDEKGREQYETQCSKQRISELRSELLTPGWAKTFFSR